jgi:hypothetical protein
MRELSLLASVRAKEVEQRRQAWPADWVQPPRSGRTSVSRPRRVLARWLMAAAGQLWPEGARTVPGGVR